MCVMPLCGSISKKLLMFFPLWQEHISLQPSCRKCNPAHLPYCLDIRLVYTERTIPHIAQVVPSIIFLEKIVEVADTCMRVS